MRVLTDQRPNFADEIVPIPESEFDILNQLIDWQSIGKSLDFIKSDYDPISLLKILLLQTWHNLSDAGVSRAIHRDLVFMKFCGFSLDGKKPDSATICRFRTKLINNNCLDRLLSMINQNLAQHDVMLNDGKYVCADATLIQSARRPRKKLNTKQAQPDQYEIDDVEYSDDSDASWTKKNGEYTYGYSTNVFTNEQGMVISANTHPANTSEMTRFGEDVESAQIYEGQCVLYDKGVSSKANREFLQANKLKDGIMRKKPRGKAFSHWHALRNRMISSKRFVVERTFGTMKRVYGLNRTRYLGLVKVQAEVLLKSMAYNIKRGVNLYKQQMMQCCA